MPQETLPVIITLDAYVRLSPATPAVRLVNVLLALGELPVVVPSVFQMIAHRDGRIIVTTPLRLVQRIDKVTRCVPTLIAFLAVADTILIRRAYLPFDHDAFVRKPPLLVIIAIERGDEAVSPSYVRFTELLSSSFHCSVLRVLKLYLR